MSLCPIAAVRIHVSDWRAGLNGYQQAFPPARRVALSAFDFACLALDGVRREIVQADAKAASGAAGSVVYWRCDDLDHRAAQLAALGAARY
ncbi:hypothetical protein [Chromobacterium alticapitis]|uniref:hypothetical protein n=1 Tax=Chromobacterium alticapitis TaxID=2073169 RepID=UPI0018EC2F52|nr:hypothetical protein [Chromobacterium alticapitis]